MSSSPTSTPVQFAERVAAAINRRCGPGLSMSYKQLAYVLQVSEPTVWSWAKAERAPSGPMLLRLLAFFDSAFANEILHGTGCLVTKITGERAREVSDALAVLARAGMLP